MSVALARIPRTDYFVESTNDGYGLSARQFLRQIRNRMTKLPARFSAFLRDFPDVGTAYRSLGEATLEAGPLDRKTSQLVKLGISIGLRHEGAVHAHCRKALEAGCTEAEIRHAAVLATTTMGFPGMMAGLSWVDDVLGNHSD